jgi:hypothetical protein
MALTAKQAVLRKVAPASAPIVVAPVAPARVAVPVAPVDAAGRVGLADAVARVRLALARPPAALRPMLVPLPQAAALNPAK